MSKVDALAVEVKEVLWDSNEQTLIIYYEDSEALNAWCERHNTRKNTPTFLKEINYNLSNPNQMFNVLCKIRNFILKSGIESKDIYKDYKTFESWFNAIVGLKVNLNEYGYLA